MKGHIMIMCRNHVCRGSDRRCQYLRHMLLGFKHKTQNTYHAGSIEQHDYYFFEMFAIVWRNSRNTKRRVQEPISVIGNLQLMLPSERDTLSVS